MIDPITQRAQEAYVAWRRDRAERESGQHSRRRGKQAPPPTAEMKARMKKARRALELRGYGWLFT